MVISVWFQRCQKRNKANCGKKEITLLSLHDGLYGKSNVILSAESLKYDVSNGDKSVFTGSVWEKPRKEKYFRARQSVSMIFSIVARFITVIDEVPSIILNLFTCSYFLHLRQVRY